MLKPIPVLLFAIGAAVLITAIVSKAVAQPPQEDIVLEMTYQGYEMGTIIATDPLGRINCFSYPELPVNVGETLYVSFGRDSTGSGEPIFSRINY